MTSVIQVDDIKTSTGSTTVLDTNQEFDTWRLTSDFSTNTAYITGWERPDGGNADACPLPIGTGLTEDNGIWSHDFQPIVDILGNYVQKWLEDELPQEYEKFIEINAKFFEE